MKVVLISCCKKKNKTGIMAAKDLYLGTLFRKSMDYAILMNPDRIYILSAEHHLLPIDRPISYYNTTLTGVSADKAKQWAKVVVNQMNKEGLDLSKDEFVILAGEAYCKYIVPHLNLYERPLVHLRIGQQLKMLNKLINLC